MIPALAALFLFIGTAAGDTGKWPARPWSEAYVHETAHYTIRTNTSPAAAEHIGALMEEALGEYRRLTGYYAEDLPRFIINAYATKEEYEAVAKKHGFPADTTNGLYTPVQPAAIHLPYVTDQGRSPDATLLHEGAHQFIDQVMSFNVPAAGRLMGVPLWLNEGLATYMEGAITDDGRFEAGRVNGPRLKHLKRLIRADEYPSLHEVMSRRYGQQFSVEDYAVAWGVVYVLNHESDPKRRQDKQGSLQLYLETCRLGFFTDPVEGFSSEFLRNGKLPPNFERLWAAYTARQSPIFFQRIIAGPGVTIEAWERDWARKIRQIKLKASRRISLRKMI